MSIQAQHPLLAKATHDEFAQQEFSASLRRFFTTQLFPKNTELYQRKLLPEFKAKHGRPPESVREVRELMEDTYFFQASSLVGRAAQEHLWDMAGESAERQIDAINARARPQPGARGSLRLDPKLEIPRYIQAVDIHAMPGNFHTEYAEGDVLQAAIYDRGVHIFAFGGLGEYCDGMGRSLVKFLKERFPDFRPRRILELGCTIGHNACAFAAAFPDAEVYGVDIGAPMLRYGHARAEALGQRLHLSQQNMIATDFPDGHFDLVYSILVMHEVPADYVRGLLKECHRVLAPGGIMMHDGGTHRSTDPFRLFLSTWFQHNVNEPFSTTQAEMDYVAEFQRAGFGPEGFFEGLGDAAYLKGQLPGLALVGSVKSRAATAAA
jgi:SAM-dependent methyltransferase